MTFTSPTQPYCRCCGKPVKKRTVLVYFGARGPDSHSARYMPDARPTTKAEAARLVNGHIVHVRHYGEHANEGGRLYSASVWDGETYEAEHFCTLVCAAEFGRMCATHYPAIETQSAAEARRARESRSPSL